MKAAPWLAVLALTACVGVMPPAPSARGAACVADGGWVRPGVGAVDGATLIDELADAAVVLLGERHDSAAHHRWQLDTITALHARGATLVIGLEMFPRRVQPALDAWVRGELDEAEFLTRSDWANVWRMDAELYMDIFRFARERRIPLRALNVERALVREVGRAGYDGVAPERREGVGRPSAAPPAYRAWLQDIRRAHHPAASDDAAAAARFVDAQLLWDRAMAEGIVAARAEHQGAVVVALIGSGHLRHGWGVPHQLASLGVDNAVILLPWDRDSRCTELVDGLATAVYGIGRPPGAGASSKQRH